MVRPRDSTPRRVSAGSPTGRSAGVSVSRQHRAPLLPSPPVAQEHARRAGTGGSRSVDAARRGGRGRGRVRLVLSAPSATYLVNDVRDREQDRRHARKRLRPVAAGELAPLGAMRLAAVMAILGVGLAAGVRPSLSTVAIGYLTLTTSYSLWWRHIVVADVLAVAAGFVLRATGGAAATGVPFAVVCDRHLGIRTVRGRRQATRRARPQHVTRPGARDAPHLHASEPAPAAHRSRGAGVRRLRLVGIRQPISRRGEWRRCSHWLRLARYGSLLEAGAGEAPEELIVGDRALLALSLLWAALFVGGVYASA